MSHQNKFYHVEPLRTKEEIEQMKQAIKRGNKNVAKRPELAERDVLIFLLGINTGLRVKDLIQLRVLDVKDKDCLLIQEGRDQREREVNVSMLRKEIESYTNNKKPESYLFPSQKGNKPVTVTQVYRILNDAADYLGRKDIGTQTIRKTFGYHHYKQFKSIAILQEIFNHTAPSITLRYIGIKEDEINESVNEFRLG